MLLIYYLIYGIIFLVESIIVYYGYQALLIELSFLPSLSFKTILMIIIIIKILKGETSNTVLESFLLEDKENAEV